MEITRTITTMFMVPTLGIPKKQLLDNTFINAFVQNDLNNLYYEDVVYLLFLPQNLDKFREFITDEYERTSSIIEDYDCADGYVVVVYKLDSELKSDFKLIQESKYSKTSTKFQKLFPETVKIPNGLRTRKEVHSLQYKIFNKSQDMINHWEIMFDVKFTEDMEVWDRFDLIKETLTLDKFKEHV